MKTVKALLARIEDAETRLNAGQDPDALVLSYDKEKPGVFYRDNQLTKKLEPDKLRIIRERAQALVFLPSNGRA